MIKEPEPRNSAGMCHHFASATVHQVSRYFTHQAASSVSLESIDEGESGVMEEGESWNFSGWQRRSADYVESGDAETAACLSRIPALILISRMSLLHRN